MNCKRIKHILLGISVVMFFACCNNGNESHTHSESCEHSHSHETHEHSEGCNHEHQTQQESFKVDQEGCETHSHNEGCNHQH